MLTNDDCETVRLVVQDPATDAVLVQSDDDPREARDMSIDRRRGSRQRDALDDKVTRVFAGKVVRKDLVRKVKVGANVPVFVLEYLLGKYCASSDEMAIQMGLAGRQRHARRQLHPARRVDEGAEPGQGAAERYTFIDKVKVRLVDSHYWAEVTNFGHQLRPHPRPLRARLRAAADRRHLGADRHALRVRRGRAGARTRSGSTSSTPIQIATFDLDEYRRLRDRVHDRRVARPHGPQHGLRAVG